MSARRHAPLADESVTDRPSRLLRLPEVSARVGFGKVTLWRWRRQGRFPEPVRIGSNSVAWIESEIDAWIAARALDRGPVRIEKELPPPVTSERRR